MVWVLFSLKKHLHITYAPERCLVCTHSPTQAKEIGVWKFEILGVGQKILIFSPEFPY